MSILLSSLK
ncbi:uncharacterized protein FFE2_16050 [Fusarium fujikuroi]|nr:uncharacterized protein FFE2_16050 [Fusarium fujikuroi]